MGDAVTVEVIEGRGAGPVGRRRGAGKPVVVEELGSPRAAGPPREAPALRVAGAPLEATLRRAAHDHGPGFTLDPMGDDWRLRLFGFLPVDWCGNLSLHCCASGVAILEGRASRVSAGRWAAQLSLALSDPEATVGALDFLRMARHRPGVSGHGAPLELFAFSCERSDEVDGALRVAVAGRDRLGFLAELLRRFAAFGLYPHELCLRTRGERAEDEFLLCGIGGLPASARAAALLERALASYCRTSPE